MRLTQSQLFRASAVLRRYAQGVALSATQRRTVAFVGSVDPDGVRRLRGTGVFVGVPAGPEGDVHLYLVTAAHVVPHYEPSFVRMRWFDDAPADHESLVEGRFLETVVDVPVSGWHRHPTADIAAALLPDADARWAISVVSLDEFVDASVHAPAVGEPVFFAGLLAQVHSMGERHVPMLRGGIIGALHQEQIPMLEPGGTRRELDGHLIDCHSFGGFSGSPCFVNMIRDGTPTPRLGLATTESHSVLLGIVGGHFDHRASVEIEGARYAVPSSAGVAVVYPCDAVRELLSIDEVVADRLERDC